MHNFALPNMNAWDPNTMIEDVQLMAMASWMNHEEKRAAELRSIIGRELSEPLMIRAEPENPSAVISNHQHLANNPQDLPEYIEQQVQAIAHFEDMERLLVENYMHACRRRWNTLPHNLKIREYHSPTRMREALARVPLYKQLMQNLQANWIGLKFNPPLLLGLLEGVKEEEEGRQWEEVERKARFHDREEDITTEVWDVWEVVKAIKDDELD